jgi:hypothetical protein
MGEDSHWCLCGTPYELLECFYAHSSVTNWYWYCFACGAIESASEHVEKKKAKGNGKEYRGAL